MDTIWLLAFGITAGLIGIFCYSFLKEPRRLSNGMWLNLLLGCILIDILLLGIQSQNHFIRLLLIIVSVIALILLLFGVYILIALLFWNSKVVLKKESSSLANLLTFILGIALSVFIVIEWFNPNRFLPEPVVMLLNMIPFMIFYLICCFMNYLSASVIYLLRKPKWDQDYLIVLGSGLINGDQVSPLLASRIKRAIQFYEEQKLKGKIPKIIFSGGQGGDEKLSEAKAMQKFALAKGIPVEDTFLENQSVNTYQNMLFSKEVIQATSSSAEKCHGLFFTNNYHVFRAGLLARKVNLAAQGVGSKTALYFLPNALLRGFVGILSLNRKRHVYVFLFVFGLLVAQAIFSLLN